ncbi:unnamed protein product [Periconia digitata]|uniref:gamma-glutamylcyclotransferase n=1 Tax=Periconia digitata TaxID=1303443 RepID=A0A9W4UJD0_9PLEO|nr:unnamed protein product [Periconia digitata]
MDTLWYFAYGSNLSVEKFTHSRGIVPLAAVVAHIPGWQISMSIPGLPYSEPAFASIEAMNATSLKEKQPDVQGVAYQITRAQYAKIIASEGGDIAYAQARLLAQVLNEADEDAVGGKTFHVLTLTNAMFKAFPGRPSFRYMDLVLSGAKTVAITPRYLHHLQTIPTYIQGTSARRKTGAFLFLLIWSPVMQLIEITVQYTVDLERGGVVPSWVKTFVRFLVSFMWYSHEFHAFFWGRGDGLDEHSDLELMDLQSNVCHSSDSRRMPWGG